MSFTIINLIKKQLGEELISQIAIQLGESESRIYKAISALIPCILAKFTEHSKDDFLLNGILESSKTGLLNNLLDESNSSLASNIITKLFGDETNEISETISAFSAVENSSINFLLNLVTEVALRSFGTFAIDHHLDKNDISLLIDNQRENILQLIPSELPLETLGLEQFLANAEKITPQSPNLENISPNNNFSTLLKWIVPLALLLYSGWYVFKIDKNEDIEPFRNMAITDSISENNSEKDTLSLLANASKEIDFNGTKLKGFPNGFEQQLIDFLQDGNYANATNEQLKEQWFTFDNVKFVFGKSDEITQESQGQLQNLATILKAYPDAKIKIGGYTDKKGNDEGNLKLSQVRADFIKAELTKLGVGSQIVAAEGYGEKFATVDENASDEEREADRKMSIRFEK